VTVYFIAARELDLVKIGYAYNPLNRFNHLRTSCPVALTLEGAIPGGRKKEREFHLRFAIARVRGEWFKLSPNLQREIDESTRPEEFTPTGIKKWLKKLIAEDEKLERQAYQSIVDPEVERRLNEQLEQSARRSLMTELQRRELDGDIYFPFRQLEEAD
jgi:hypothetical protein